MTNVEEITEIAIWWQELPYDFNGLNDVMFNQQRLSGYLLSLANEIARQRKDLAKSRIAYEAKKNEKRVQFGNTNAGQKADWMARANIKKEYEAEQMDEAIYYGLKDIYDATKEVLDAMQQRVAHLRAEWALKNYTGA